MPQQEQDPTTIPGFRWRTGAISADGWVVETAEYNDGTIAYVPKHVPASGLWRLRAARCNTIGLWYLDQRFGWRYHGDPGGPPPMPTGLKADEPANDGLCLWLLRADLVTWDDRPELRAMCASWGAGNAAGVPVRPEDEGMRSEWAHADTPTPAAARIAARLGYWPRFGAPASGGV